MAEGIVTAYIQARKKFRDRQYHGEFGCSACPEAFAAGWDAGLAYAQDIVKKLRDNYGTN